MKIKPKKIVCVFAHPDDESFGPGGTLAFLSKHYEVHLICVTCGDTMKRFSLSNKDGDELAKVRVKELNEAADILGLKSVTTLGFKDGSLCNNNYHEVASEINKITDKIKPDTLLTFYLDGVTGHLDHVAVSMEVSYLFEKLNYVKNLIYFVQNPEMKSRIRSNYFVYFPVGLELEEIDWIHDVSMFYKTKILAMKAHKTQFKDFIKVKALFGDLLKVEMFKVLSK